MKKVFNLTVILAALMTAFVFSSCSKEDGEAPVITASVLGDGLVGTITSDSDLKTATLEKSGTTVAGWPLNDFGAGKAISGSKSTGYNIVITGLSNGDYSLVVTDKDDRKATKTFTIGTVVAGPDWSTGTNVITANGDYYYKQGDTESELTVSELTTTSVKVALKGKSAATLSDADASYLLTDGTSSKQAGATATNFLLAKSGGKAEIVDADGLKTKIPGAATVIFVVKK